MAGWWCNDDIVRARVNSHTKPHLLVTRGAMCRRVTKSGFWLCVITRRAHTMRTCRDIIAHTSSFTLIGPLRGLSLSALTRARALM